MYIRRKKSGKKIWKGRGNGLCAESYGFRHGKGRDRCESWAQAEVARVLF